MNKTQKQLAEELSYTPQAISRFESLDSGFPLEFLPALCLSLECSVKDLYSRNLVDPHYEQLDPGFLSRISERISSIRIKKDKTQKELSELSDVTERSLRKYEKGETLPSFQTLERFAIALDEDIIAFFKDEDKSSVIPESIIAPKKHFRWGFAAILSVFIVALIGGAIAIPISIAAKNSSNTPSDSHIEGNSLPNDHTSQNTDNNETKSEPIAIPLRYSFSQDKYVFSSSGDSIILNVDYDDNASFGNVLQEGSGTTIRFPKEYEPFVDVDYSVVDAHHIELVLVNSSRSYKVPFSISIDGELFEDVFHVKVPASSPVFFAGEDAPFSTISMGSPESTKLEKGTPQFINLSYFDQNGDPVVYSNYAAEYSLSYESQLSYGFSDNKTTVLGLKKKASAYFILYSTGRSQIAFAYQGGLKSGVYILWFTSLVYEQYGSTESYDYCFDPVVVEIDDPVEEETLECIQVSGDFSPFSTQGEKRVYELSDQAGKMDLSSEPFESRITFDLSTFDDTFDGAQEEHKNPFSMTRIDSIHFEVQCNDAWHGDGITICVFFDLIEYGSFNLFFRVLENSHPYYACYENEPGQEFYDAYLVCISHPNLQARKGEIIAFDIYLSVPDGNGGTKEINTRGSSFWNRGGGGACSYPNLWRFDLPNGSGFFVGGEDCSFSYREAVNSPKENVTPDQFIGCFRDGKFMNFHISPVTVAFI